MERPVRPPGLAHQCRGNSLDLVEIGFIRTMIHLLLDLLLALMRFSGFNQPGQCRDDALRMLVTGGPPDFGGGGRMHDHIA
jgi:hypothetical protein